MESPVGYKEWIAVCEALGNGHQHLLLRRGGIHEGREGFSFKHGKFFLFPTRFHAQASQVRVACETGSPGEWQAGEEVPIDYWCEAHWARTLTDWDLVRQLEPFHVWTEDVVRERFDCGEEQQIHCALVRAHRLSVPWSLPYERKYGGCRTWVDLPVPPAGLKLAPVIPDSEFGEIRARIEALTG